MDEKKRAIELKDCKFMSAEDKKKILKQWDSFLKVGFAYGNFTNALYEHLKMHCGFIAHFDRYGFYATYFEDPERSIAFLKQFDKDYGCVSVEHGATWWMDGEYEDINSEMCRIADEYKTWLYKNLKDDAKDRDMEIAKILLRKHGISIECIK